jgi:NAD-dependent SIR2 family protein deacetylase
MGSSLRVTPAADMPKVLSKDKNKNLVIVNIQLTPLDDICSLRIFALCDKVIEKLMKALSIEVDPFLLRRVVSVL